VAVKLIGDIVGSDRFAHNAQVTRCAGAALIPAFSGRCDRRHLDPGRTPPRDMSRIKALDASNATGRCIFHVMNANSTDPHKTPATAAAST
jgi:hypothetical protein